jgi:NAD(P)-dependent dehydrogenase (short-subunit alcohol dehydrogenase family)
VIVYARQRPKLRPAIRSSGLGLATVLELHRCGGYSAVLDIQDIPEKAKLALGSKARYFKCDLSKSEDIEQAVNQAVSWSKETDTKLGGVINSGGVAVAAKVSHPSVRCVPTNILPDNHRERCTSLLRYV